LPPNFFGFVADLDPILRKEAAAARILPASARGLSGQVLDLGDPVAHRPQPRAFAMPLDHGCWFDHSTMALRTGGQTR